MANVNLPVIDLTGEELVIAQPGFVGFSSSSVGIIPNIRGMILKIGNGASIANLTLAAAPGYFPLQFQIAANATVYLRLPETTPYIQSDGNLHITSDQSISSVFVLTH